jgi:hypothetical protein
MAAITLASSPSSWRRVPHGGEDHRPDWSRHRWSERDDANLGRVSGRWLLGSA